MKAIRTSPHRGVSTLPAATFRPARSSRELTRVGRFVPNGAPPRGEFSLRRIIGVRAVHQPTRRHRAGFICRSANAWATRRCRGRQGAVGILGLARPRPSARCARLRHVAGTRYQRPATATAFLVARTLSEPGGPTRPPLEPDTGVLQSGGSSRPASSSSATQPVRTASLHGSASRVWRRSGARLVTCCSSMPPMSSDRGRTAGGGTGPRRLRNS